MRIVAEIPHERLKISIFFHNARYTIQFEDGVFIQSFTLRESDQFDRLDKIKGLVDEDFISKVDDRFKSMGEDWQDKILSSSDDIEFERII